MLFDTAFPLLLNSMYQAFTLTSVLVVTNPLYANQANVTEMKDTAVKNSDKIFNFK